MICNYCDKEFGDEFESRPYCDNKECEAKHYAQSDGRIYANYKQDVEPITTHKPDKE